MWQVIIAIVGAAVGNGVALLLTYLTDDAGGLLWMTLGAVLTVVITAYVTVHIPKFATLWRRRRLVALLFVFLACGLGGVVSVLGIMKVASLRQQKEAQIEERQARMQAAQARMVEGQERLEFLQQRADPVERAVLRVYLDNHYKTHEMGDFRVLVRTSNSHREVFYSAYGPAGLDGSPALEVNGQILPQLGTRVTVWRADGNYNVVDIPVDRFEHKAAATNFVEVISGKGNSYEKLGDFDDTRVSIWMTENLWKKTAAVALEANDYVLLSLPRRCLTTTTNEHISPPIPIKWPERRAPKSGETLLKVVPASYRPDEMPLRLTFPIRYAQNTPILISKLQGSRAEIEFPKCDGSGAVTP